MKNYSDDEKLLLTLISLTMKITALVDKLNGVLAKAYSDYKEKGDC